MATRKLSVAIPSSRTGKEFILYQHSPRKTNVKKCHEQVCTIFDNLLNEYIAHYISAVKRYDNFIKGNLDSFSPHWTMQHKHMRIFYR